MMDYVWIGTIILIYGGMFVYYYYVDIIKKKN